MSLFGFDNNENNERTKEEENNIKKDISNVVEKTSKKNTNSIAKPKSIKVVSDNESETKKINIELKTINSFRSVEENIINHYKNNTLHHSIMISGNYGIGKASFVYYLISKMLEINIEKIGKDNNLSNVEIEGRKKDLINILKNNEHPDIFFLNMNTNGDKSKNEITISQVRWIIEKINLKSSFGCKFIIIDDINSMNNNGVNAFLKTLEEPPENTYIFLINHKITKLLDTIYSRCNEVKLHLSRGDCMKILQQRNGNWDYNFVEFYTDISNNSVAFAEKLAEFELIKFNNIKIEELKDFINKIYDIIDKNTEYSRILKMSLLEKIIVYFLNKNLLNFANSNEDIKKNISLNNNILKQFLDIKKFELPVKFI